MTARTLLGLFDVVYLLALAAWVGSIAFFSFGVAPVIFRVLSPAEASRFVRTLFPRYYLWGATAAAIALPAVVCGPMAYPEFRGPGVGIRALLVLVGGLIMLYCGNALTPAINAARDAGPASQARFDALHRRSVRLNAVSLLIGVGLLAAYPFRPSPRTEGIVERKPGELSEGQETYLRQADEIGRKLSDPKAVDRLMKEKAEADRSGKDRP